MAELLTYQESCQGSYMEYGAEGARLKGEKNKCTQRRAEWSINEKDRLLMASSYSCSPFLKSGYISVVGVQETLTLKMFHSLNLWYTIRVNWNFSFFLKQF